MVCWASEMILAGFFLVLKESHTLAFCLETKQSFFSCKKSF